MNNKIMMVEPLGDGGIVHYTYNLLNALCKKGMAPLLYTTCNYELRNETHGFAIYPKMYFLASKLIEYMPSLNSENKKISILRKIIKLIEYPFNIMQLIGILNRDCIKIVHLQSINWIDIFMVICLKKAKKKVVLTIHNVNPLHKEPKKYQIKILHKMYGLTDRLIIHTNEGKEKIVSIYDVDPEKIKVLPHGNYNFFVPDEEISKSDAKRLLGIKESVKTILFFGAIRQNKGLDQAIISLNLICKKIKNIKLMIIGELCENFQKYNQLIEKFGLQEKIYKKLDYIPNEEVPLYFIASDIVILPYHEITQSGVLQIAYAFGKPVIATDLEGFRESIFNNQNGYLIKSGDYEGFANKTVLLLNNNDKLKKMGDFSKKLTEGMFSWDGIADNTYKNYKELVG